MIGSIYTAESDPIYKKMESISASFVFAKGQLLEQDRNFFFSKQLGFKK